MNMEVAHTREEDKDLLKVAGEIDAYTAPELREALVPLTEKEGNLVVVDLENVDYIDSTGLGIFIGALKSAHNYNGDLKIIGLNERVHRLFSITGLDEVIDIGEEREEAK
ncbi:anti-sigma B factor antagonist [Salsuginibacillus halophilus]|uniref:Anti-sigma factor antagonist n=1 Tax=Salsuginibacillus halophilus TaxID=517424 RepID=A0A2P8H8D6_9BACI|nr:STAS domain-containing protein [Salsuginibacillus halophilus]PSL42464.1 anti-sigma B factor antagonist [Salsuginibacillus halophilus]